MKTRNKQNFKQNEQYAFQKYKEKNAIARGDVTSVRKIAKSYSSYQYLLFEAIPAPLKQQVVAALPRTASGTSKLGLSQALAYSFIFFTASNLVTAVAAERRVPARVAHLVEDQAVSGPEMSSGYTYKSYFAERHDNLICREKTWGENPGAFCIINGKEFILKAITGKPIGDHLFDPAATIYNKNILAKFGFQTPGYKFIYADSKTLKGAGQKTKLPKADYYFAMEVLQSFDTAAKFSSQPTFQEMFANADKEQVEATFTKIVKNKVGLPNFRKFLVACSLIADLLDNWTNWGFIGNEIAVVDMDLAPFSIRKRMARFSSEVAKTNFLVTGGDLEFMKKTYMEMKASNNVPTSVPDYAGLSESELFMMLDAYIEACDEAITKVKTSGLKMHDAKRLVNELFADEIKQAYFKHFEPNQSAKLK